MISEGRKGKVNLLIKIAKIRKGSEKEIINFKGKGSPYLRRSVGSAANQDISVQNALINEGNAD